MKTFLCSLLSIGLLRIVTCAAAVDEDKPYGRVCVSLVEAGDAGKEQAFRSNSVPGTGKKIRIHLDASLKCLAAVAALRKDGKLAFGWRPQVVDLADDFEDAQLPPTGGNWEWAGAPEGFDFYVLFLSPGTKDADEFKRLILAMQNPKADEHLLALQTNKLRELLGKISGENDRASHLVANDPEVGGVFRGSAFPWRQFAKAVNFAPDRPGVLIIPSSAEGADANH